MQEPPVKRTEIAGFNVFMRLDSLDFGQRSFRAEDFLEIAQEYRNWRDRVKPFASFQEVAQALLQQSYSPRGPITVLRIERSEPVGVYWAQVRIGNEEVQIKNWEDWNELQRARPIKESGL